MKAENLTIADQVIIGEMRKWPRLYSCSRDVFHQCIVSGDGSGKWKDGLFVLEDSGIYKGTDEIGNPYFQPTPLRISEEVALDFYNRTPMFVYVHNCSYSIENMPDNMHKAWQDFIAFNLYMDSKLTPDLYAILVEARCIAYYGKRINPHARMADYLSSWNTYYQKISGYQARLDYIRKFQETGKIPPETFMGSGI